MSSFEVQLGGIGWNSFGYPIRGAARPIEEALASIAGAYDSVWHYNSVVATSGTTATWEAWTTMQVSAPAWVSDLETLAFGEGYWISITQELDSPLYLEGPLAPEEEPATAQLASGTFSTNAPNVPALYYTVLTPSTTLTPTVGMQVEAYINGTLCGASETQEIAEGQIGFRIVVAADSAGGVAGCGAPGRIVTFLLDGERYAATLWHPSQAFDLQTLDDYQLYLPLIYR